MLFSENNVFDVQFSMSVRSDGISYAHFHKFVLLAMVSFDTHSY